MIIPTAAIEVVQWLADILPIIEPKKKPRLNIQIIRKIIGGKSLNAGAHRAQ